MHVLECDDGANVCDGCARVGVFEWDNMTCVKNLGTDALVQTDKDLPVPALAWRTRRMPATSGSGSAQHDAVFLQHDAVFPEDHAWPVSLLRCNNVSFQKIGIDSAKNRALSPRYPRLAVRSLRRLCGLPRPNVPTRERGRGRSCLW